MQALVIKKSIQTWALRFIVVMFAIFGAHAAEAATLSVVPGTGVYTAGQIFTATVIVNTNSAPINAADGTLTFDPSQISVVSVSKGSIFSLWTAEPAFSNAQGTIEFSGGSPSGYTGTNGAVLNISFRAAAAGSPKISFSKGSVLAADGRGTNVLTAMNGAAFTITAKDTTPVPEKIEYVAPANTPAAPVVESSTHQDQAKWYAVTKAELSWKLPSDVVSIRTLLDESPSTIPTKVYDTPISSLSIPDLADGVHYFHIQFKNDHGWGKVTNYRLAVDTQKPSKFEIALPEGADLSNPVQILMLTTQDASSQVRRFNVQIDGKDPYEYIDQNGSSTVTLTALEPGHHSIIIEAFDEAGNSLISTFSFDILAFNKPQFTEYPSQINEQVIPVIKGVTKPNSKVTISITQIGLGVSSQSAVKKYEVTSSQNGEFILVPDGRFSLGVYELTAFAVDAYGAQSDVSDPIRIAVEEPGYLKIGSFVISFLSVVIPLLGLLTLLVIGFWFLLMRLRGLRKGVTKEAVEAEEMLVNEFTQLRSALMKQRSMLESSRKTKKLTKAEEELFASLALSLDAAQKRVSKEITDVEDLVE